MSHQKEATQFLLTRKKCILSLDMGMGKTLTSIIASLMYGHKKVLVICPASIKTIWKSELSRFIDEDQINIIKGFNEMNKQELIDFLNIKDPKQYKVEELRSMAKEVGKWNEGKQFTIVNFDIIDEFHSNSRKQNADSDLLKSDFDVVIIDEAHKLSDNTSNRFKTIRNYLKRAKNEYTWLLTGTMLTNDVKNLYNLLSLIENDITGDYDFYMEHYCGAKKILKKGEWDRCWHVWNKGRYASYYSMTDGNKKAFKEYVDKAGKHVMVANESNNLEELQERIDHLYYRKTKEDIMPVDKVIVPCVYRLTEEQKNEYDKLWDVYEAEKREEGKDVSEIKQLVSVAVNRQYISKIMVPNTINLTNKLLEKGKKVFIVCCYDEELYSLHEYFGNKSVIFNGKMNQKQKDTAVELFNNDDNIKILIGNITAVGVGINLNKSCNHAIFQNLDFTDASFSQACDRIYRIGSKENAYIYLPYFKDTVYEHIIDIITRKKQISEQVIKNN
jgi:SNF2 family DNA or RNA helicase